MNDCEDRAQELLKEKEPESFLTSRRAAAKEMCKLLESGKLKKDLGNQSVDIEYIVSRLEVREGEDNPTLKQKWNWWLSMKTSFNENGIDYTPYQI